MVFDLVTRSLGKSTIEADLLEHALARGRRVLVVRASGNAVYQRFRHLTSITPVREMPPDLWLDECATIECCHFDTPDNDDHPPARAA